MRIYTMRHLDSISISKYHFCSLKNIFYTVTQSIFYIACSLLGTKQSFQACSKRLAIELTINSCFCSKKTTIWNTCSVKWFRVFINNWHVQSLGEYQCFHVLKKTFEHTLFWLLVRAIVWYCLVFCDFRASNI